MGSLPSLHLLLSRLAYCTWCSSGRSDSGALCRPEPSTYRLLRIIIRAYIPCTCCSRSMVRDAKTWPRASLGSPNDDRRRISTTLYVFPRIRLRTTHIYSPFACRYLSSIPCRLLGINPRSNHSYAATCLWHSRCVAHHNGAHCRWHHTNPWTTT